MPPRIVLVRHGPSAHIPETGPIDRAGVQRWRDAYDSAGIRTGAQPPAALLRTAAAATHIVTSDLPRAVGSAEALAPARPIRRSDLLRETPLTIPHWPTRLPLNGWGIAVYLAWTYRIVRGIDEGEPERTRAAAAAALLADLVADDSTALVVTHGVFRRLLAKQLLDRGWMSTGRRGGYRHWSSWSFRGPTDRR